jgi:hypothetical protein
MGFFSKIFKKAKKIVKPITKIVKKVAKKVKTIGKAVMKGVAKISNKLGPIGMIAMSIAMPYALTGLSNFTNFAQAYQGVGQTFLNAVGTVGNQIRFGYQTFNTSMSIAKKSITDVIGKTFQKFAPKGGTNIFSRISDGAKRLYTATKKKLQSVTPKFRTAVEGTVQADNTAMGYGFGETTTLSSSQAAKAFELGQISGEQLSQQTLSGKGGWFTSTNAVGVSNDKIVSEVINDAYKTRLDGFGVNAKRMFNDIKNKALEMDTYINDEQIGSFVENNKSASSYSNKIMEYTGDMDYTGSQKFQIKTEIPNLGTTGDYRLVGPIEGGGDASNYVFNGNETFGKQPATKNFFQKNANKLKNLTKGILSPTGNAPASEDIALPLRLDTSRIDMANSTYDGTNQKSSEGGSLVAAQFGQRAADIIRYTGNMNALNSGVSFVS